VTNGRTMNRDREESRESSAEDETKRPSTDARPRGTGQSADLGYGRSHGHSPGHEGPTGPGDAPAPVKAPKEKHSDD